MNPRECSCCDGPLPIALSCQLTEAKILAACILRPEIFEWLSDIGVDHFFTPRHRETFAAMRRLQAAGCDVGVLEVVDDIAMEDVKRERRVSDHVDPAFLGLLILDASPYTEEILFDRDVEWLRKLHDRRAALR